MCNLTGSQHLKPHRPSHTNAASKAPPTTMNTLEPRCTTTSDRRPNGATPRSPRASPRADARRWRAPTVSRQAVGAGSRRARPDARTRALHVSQPGASPTNRATSTRLLTVTSSADGQKEQPTSEVASRRGLSVSEVLSIGPAPSRRRRRFPQVLTRPRRTYARGARRRRHGRGWRGHPRRSLRTARARCEELAQGIR